MGCIPRFYMKTTNDEIAAIEADILDIRAHNEKFIREFEADFARYIGRKHAIFLPSARYGLYQVLKNSGLKEGDMVIVPAWTHYSVPATIIAAGLVPLFADIEEGTYNMTVNTIPLVYWNMAKAIIITHIYGCPAPVEDIMDIARDHNMVIIEDCAQSLGATIFGKMTGSFGDASIFSLSITKNLTTLKGGMLVTDRNSLADKVRMGITDDFVPMDEIKKVLKTCKTANKVISQKFFSSFVHPALILASFINRDPIHEKFIEPVVIKKPPDKVPSPHPVQARLGKRQLVTIDTYNSERHENGVFMMKALEKLKNINVPRIQKGHAHIFMSFVIMAKDPWELKKHLLFNGVDTAPGYLHNNPDLPEFNAYYSKCPVAEKLDRRQLHLPVYPGLSKDHLKHICMEVAKFYKKK